MAYLYFIRQISLIASMRLSVKLTIDLPQSRGPK